MHLGYSSLPDALATLGGFDLVYPQVVVDRVETVLTYLDSVDTAIDSAVSNAQVKKVGSLEFEYGALISNKRNEASRQLQELGNLLGASIQFNKYKAGASQSYVVDY